MHAPRFSIVQLRPLILLHVYKFTQPLRVPQFSIFQLRPSLLLQFKELNQPLRVPQFSVVQLRPSLLLHVIERLQPLHVPRFSFVQPESSHHSSLYQLQLYFLVESPTLNLQLFPLANLKAFFFLSLLILLFYLPNLFATKKKVLSLYLPVLTFYFHLYQVCR